MHKTKQIPIKKFLIVDMITDIPYVPPLCPSPRIKF